MAEPYSEDEINLRDYWRVLVRHRALIVGLVCLTAVSAVIFTLRQPNIYQSKATLMPLGNVGGGLQSMLGQVSGLLPAGALSQKSPAERIMAILNSRTLAEDVIQRLHLLPRLFAREWDAGQQHWRTDTPPTLQDAVRALAGLVAISSDKKTGIITIAVEHTDPDLAATIANQYIAALHRILNARAFSLAKKNRLFIEAQLQNTRRELTAAEETLRQFEQAHKIIALDEQAKAAVKAVASLESQIMAREVQLRVLQRTVTGASREVTLLQEELRGLRAQLQRLQYGSKTSPASVANGVRTTQVVPTIDEAPEIKLQYERLRREATVQRQLFTLLSQQLERARIAESRDETAFQVLDRAIPPDRKSKPRRALSVILATIVGAFVGVLAAFFKEYLEAPVRSREQLERQSGLPLLASIPAVPARRRWVRRGRRPEAELVWHQAPGTPVVEAYRYLHTRLQRLKDGRQTILFTSPGPDDTAPTMLANLAIVAAGMGDTTLLIDANLRQPVFHQLLHCPIAPGLEEVLGDPEAWQKGIQMTSVDNLHLLPAGQGSATTCMALQSPVFEALLARCKAIYTLILCAAPPVLAVSDAALLGRQVEATCLVVTSGVSRLDAVADAKAALEAVGANVVGTVLLA